VTIYLSEHQVTVWHNDSVLVSINRLICVRSRMGNSSQVQVMLAPSWYLINHSG